MSVVLERVDRRALRRRNRAGHWRLLGAAACVLVAPGFIAVIVVEGVLQSTVVGSAGLVAALAGLVWTSRADRVPSVAELARKGLAKDVLYRATRCLQIQDPDEHGPCYLVELDSGESLYVGGRWLAAYEPTDDARRRFPCTEFVAVRRTSDREVIGLRCSGAPIEPEAVKAFVPDRAGLELPANGDVLPAGGYEETKRHLPDGKR